MAVHNGARLIDSQLTHLASVEPHLIHEIIVVSDGSTDDTVPLAQACAEKLGKQPLPNAVIHVIPLPAHVGKSAALNAAIERATAEILLFIDIRPKVQPGAIPALLSNFADPTVGCVAGELLLNTDGHSATASAVSGLYWRYEQGIRNCEAAVSSPVGVYGGFYAIRRALATPFPPGLILDDMFQPLSIIRQGYRSVLDRTAFVLDTWPAQTAGEFARKVRTLAGNFQLVARAPWLLTPANPVLFQLVSHKLLRLAVPYCFLTLLVSSILLGLHSTAYAIFAALQLAFWLMSAVALKYRIPVLHRIANPASAMLVLNAAAIAGLYKFLFTRGPLWKIWSPTPISPASPSPGTTAYTPPPSSPA